LTLAKDIDAKNVMCKRYSQLTIDHMIEEFKVKDPLLLKYYHKVFGMFFEFDTTTMEHI